MDLAVLRPPLGEQATLLQSLVLPSALPPRSLLRLLQRPPSRPQSTSSRCVPA